MALLLWRIWLRHGLSSHEPYQAVQVPSNSNLIASLVASQDRRCVRRDEHGGPSAPPSGVRRPGVCLDRAPTTPLHRPAMGVEKGRFGCKRESPQFAQWSGQDPDTSGWFAPVRWPLIEVTIAILQSTSAQ